MPNVGSTLDQAIRRHVDTVLPDLSDKFEAEEQVAALLSHPGWAHVARVLEAEVATIDRRLDAGPEPLSRAQYASAHGRRGGLRGAEQAARAILEAAAKAHAEQRRKHESGTELSLEGV